MWDTVKWMYDKSESPRIYVVVVFDEAAFLVQLSNTSL